MRKTYLVMAVLVTSLCALSARAMGTTYYLDGSVSSAGNGLSWASAWKSFSDIKGLKAGDTVYVSGGSTSQSYSLSNWTPTGGTSGSPITYAVGQDTGHNGTVSITSSTFLSGTLNDVVINGNVSGAQHWSVTASGQFWEGGSGTNQRVTIRNVTATMHGGFHWPSASNTTVEIDHNNFVNDHDYVNGQDFTFYGGPGTGAHQILVHDNYIQSPYFTQNHSCGDDVWIWPGNVDFYNNTVKGMDRSTYTNVCPGVSQHSDVFQQGNSSNIYFYNNTIIDSGESVFYQDAGAASPGVSNVLIYNNLLVRTEACNSVERAFDMNPEGGGSGAVAYTDIVIANNTAVDFGACNFFLRYQGAGSYTRVYAVNNIQYPTSSSITVDAGVISSNNYGGSGIQFVSYNQWGGSNNDLHLVNSDTALIDQGRDMSTYFTVDKDGVARPQGSAWDIGAYEFSDGSTPPSPPTGLAAVIH